MENRKPFVSVIIPVLNGEEYIEKCIKRILMLNYPKDKYEIIVIDNGSVDNTNNIIRRYEQIKLYEKRNINVSGVRNYGAKIAKGELLAFIDADCLCDEEWVNKFVLRMNKNKLTVIGAHYKIPNDVNWVGKVWDAARIKQRSKSGKVNYVPAGNFIIDRETFHKIGGFNESLTSDEDVDICHRLRNKGIDVFSDPELAVVHLGENISLIKFFKKEIWRGKEVVKLYVLDKRKSNLKSALVACYYAICFFVAIFTTIFIPVFENAIKILFIISLLWALPAFIISLISVCRSKKYLYYLQTVLLYLVFFTARSLALFLNKNTIERIVLNK